MNARAARASAAATLLVVLAGTGHARAFCRTSTGKTADDCTPSGENCCTLGDPIWWKQACIGFSMTQGSTKRNISAPIAANTISQAFAIWTATSCPGDEQTTRVSIDVRRLPVAECTEAVTYVDGRKNQNIIVFRDNVWPRSDGDRVLGLTSVKFDPRTGQILGADLELNTADHNLVCATKADADPTLSSCFDLPPPPDAFDFASVVTHEVGHFLGIGHSNDERATMAAQYANAGSQNFTLRSLTSDDIAAICHAYPASGLRRTGPGGSTLVPQGPCDPEPYHGFSSTCDPGGCGCELVGRARRDEPLSTLQTGAAVAGCLTIVSRRRSRLARSRKGG